MSNSLFIQSGSIFFISGSYVSSSNTDTSPTSSVVTGKWEIDPDDGESIQFRVPKEKIGTTHDRIGFYISSSGKVGIGTKDPATAFDVRDASQDVDPKLARSNKEALLKLSRDAAEKDIKAEKLRTARTIGGVSFDGSANINLPGVNARGDQDTTGNAATATTSSFALTSSMTTGNAASATQLETARTIGGVSFDGSANINLPGVNAEGNQNTSGNAETAGKITVTADESSANHPLIFIDDTTPDGEAESLKASRAITINPNTGELTLGNLAITFTQGDGRSTFGTITFTAPDASGARRTATINLS